MQATMQEVFSSKGKRLLAIGKQGYKSHGIGAVLFTVDRPEVIYAPARDLSQFMTGSVLDGAKRYCATYEPAKQIVLVVFGANDHGAAVTIAG